MKTYYLTLSQVFPSTHPNAGRPTGFREKVLKSIKEPYRSDIPPKIHTIRANYEFWRKRFEKIEAGEAVLSIREWVGKPYGKGSTQREIVRLTREDGIGLQKLHLLKQKWGSGALYLAYVDDRLKDNNKAVSIAHNDGLSVHDWLRWFEGYNLNEPLAIIHFTKFRY